MRACIIYTRVCVCVFAYVYQMYAPKAAYMRSKPCGQNEHPNEPDSGSCHALSGGFYGNKLHLINEELLFVSLPPCLLEP